MPSSQLSYYYWQQAAWLALGSHTIYLAPAIEIEAPQTACPSVIPGEKFLVYHTHSGFHNQRIALENAITLSHLLNRTLIMSPIRLGKPIRYCNFRSLYNHLQLSDKVGLEHCARLSSDSSLPPECFVYFDYTHIPWSWLVDFASIQSRHKVLIRGNHTDRWVYGCLGIAESDVLTLEESSRYQYRFTDSPNAATGPSDKFSETVSIPKLRATQESLLHLGTLFGTSRLLLEDEESARIRRRIREGMTFTNPLLIEISRSIEELLGSHFIGVHVRLGDGGFLESGEGNTRSIWWTLVHEVLKLTVNDAIALEASKPLYSSPPVLAPYTVNTNPASRFSAPRLQCYDRLHTVSQLNPLNTPLYLATDARHPRDDPSLMIFFKTFPCTFTLADMVDQLAPLNDLVNGADGLKLKPFLLPFVDAMVLSRAWNVVGTTSSTFSAFVVDVLWPRFHGFDVRERG
ncbi:hypothetical protein E1B28_010009 [Marasmius oreades]|uniref:O-fucosyltransferase family protein n=1 Tax=Marasmius oreades TaxID=181124 RepID=A0A9P7RXE7_9AGAR|nr:uncharacterized protein E1B28_010009 [Marasmius oreades]KAG7090936.1 hypothetical protein E1B28_010009 [Marasmius oreades]